MFHLDRVIVKVKMEANHNTDDDIVDKLFPTLQELSEDDSGCDGFEKSVRSSRTKAVQFQTLFAFMETHSDFTKGKTTEKQAAEWDTLTKELNSLGPPEYSSKRWRKVWSDHKGNKKRVKVTETVTQLKTFIESTLLSDSTNCSPTITGKNGDDFDSQSGIALKIKEVGNGNVDSKDKVENTENTVTDILTKLQTATQLQMKANECLNEVIEMVKEKFNSV